MENDVSDDDLSRNSFNSDSIISDSDTDCNFPLPSNTGETLLSANTSCDYGEYGGSVFELKDGAQVILQGKIGQGNYGTVFRGQYEYENDVREVAVKRLTKDSKGDDLKDFQREINIMLELQHPNIVKIITIIDSPLSVVMEYVKHHSFLVYLSSRPTLTIQRLLKFAKDIASGMAYLVSKKIVHRDLAARNILVDIDERLKISDFGLAQFADSNGYYLSQHCREIPIKW